MNRKILGFAVAAALTLPMAAQADVKVFGRVQVAVSNLDTDTGRDDGWNVEDDYGQSRIGFIISEKLGMGLTGIAKLAWSVDPAEKDGTWAEREQYVGLKGGWGQFRMGINTSPYKAAGGVKLDAFLATAMEARSFARSGGIGQTKGGMSRARQSGLGHSSFVDNSLTYYSPKFAGIQLAAMWIPDEVDSKDGAGIAGEGQNNYSGSLTWEGLGFWVGGALSHDECATEKASGGCQDADLYKLFARWKGGPFGVYGQYEWDKDGMSNSVSSGEDGAYWIVGGDFKFGNTILDAGYGQFDADKDSLCEFNPSDPTAVPGVGNDSGDIGVDCDTKWYRVGAIYKFSKKSRAFIGYRVTDSDGVTDKEKAFSVGLRQDF